MSISLAIKQRSLMRRLQNAKKSNRFGRDTLQIFPLVYITAAQLFRDNKLTTTCLSASVCLHGGRVELPVSPGCSTVPEQPPRFGCVMCACGVVHAREVERRQAQDCNHGNKRLNGAVACAEATVDMRTDSAIPFLHHYAPRCRRNVKVGGEKN